MFPKHQCYLQRWPEGYRVVHVAISVWVSFDTRIEDLPCDTYGPLRDTPEEAWRGWETEFGPFTLTSHASIPGGSR